MTRMDFNLERLAKRHPNLFGGLDETATDEEVAAEEARQRALDAAARERVLVDRAERFLQDRGQRYRNCRLSTFEATEPGQAEAVARLRSYAENMPAECEQGNGVILYGPSGTGKDHLLVALGFAAERRYGLRVAWRNGMELFAGFRQAIHEDADEWSIVRPLADADILVLSDPLPPSGDLTDYQKSMLYRVLETRYTRCKPTWASVNAKCRNEVDSRMGAPCADRLRHNAVTIFCKWQSYRKAQPNT